MRNILIKLYTILNQSENSIFRHSLCLHKLSHYNIKNILKANFSIFLVFRLVKFSKLDKSVKTPNLQHIFSPILSLFLCFSKSFHDVVLAKPQTFLQNFLSALEQKEQYKSMDNLLVLNELYPN